MLKDNILKITSNLDHIEAELAELRRFRADAIDVGFFDLAGTIGISISTLGHIRGTLLGMKERLEIQEKQSNAT